MNSSNIKFDIQAGISVFLLALPLCLGIAMASNFPPVAGIITAIVGGLISTFFGSSRLTIKGPAAGLIVIALGAVNELGGGDVILGYKRALAVGVISAVIQIILAVTKTGKIAEVMPPSVIHGILAAIGVIIIAKQTYVMMGENAGPGNPLLLLMGIPLALTQVNPEIFFIGGLALAIVLLWPSLGKTKLSSIPASVVVLVISIPFTIYFDLTKMHDYMFAGSVFNVGPKFLISLPAQFTNAITFPDFSVITSVISIKYIIMFAVVGSIESLLTVIAIDSIDSEKRTSDLNKDLFATGVGNLFASLIGGLPMISEIVRSKANIDYGAKTKMANFYHSLFLLLSIVAFPAFLQMIPLSALAALLVFTGIRLAHPREFKHTLEIGIDQFILFVVTLVITLLSDLLIGVAAGLGLKLVMHYIRGVKIYEFFRYDFNVVQSKNHTIIKPDGSLVFTNYLSLKNLILKNSGNDCVLIVDFEKCKFVDHMILMKIYELQNALGPKKLIITGLASHKGTTPHYLSSKKKWVFNDNQ